MSILKLARPEIVAMKPYSSARKEATSSGVLLNANESPWPLLDSPANELSLNRYPEPQPGRLLDSLAKLYDLPADHVLITRGSDEGIDLLTRVFCRAGKDAILHCPPTFGMYRIAAEIQGAAVVSVPRLADQGFRVDTEGVLRELAGDERIRLIFLTSPNNPTGDYLDQSFLQELLEVSDEKAIVVMDEAYAEFCQRDSATRLISRHPQLVVLRTLSKAWASAGLRCGAVLAQPQLIDLLGRVIAPYPLAGPVASQALRVLQPDMMLRQQKLLREIRSNKDLLLSMLENRSFVGEIWPGEANFVLLRIKRAAHFLAHCAEHGVIVRGYAHDPDLKDCIRITVGSKQDLAALEQALNRWETKQT